MEPLVVEVRGRVNVLCSMKMEAWRSIGVFWMDSWNTKGLFMQYTQHRLIALYISQLMEQQTLLHCHCYREGGREELSAFYRHITCIELFHIIWLLNNDITTLKVFWNKREGKITFTVRKGATPLLLCWPISVSYITFRAQSLFGYCEQHIHFLNKCVKIDRGQGM